jgi:hypothetical protein
MWETYNDYMANIEEEATKAGFSDFKLAREEFHNATGKFEDGEAWFELRMKMFIDWYLLDRLGPSGRTPAEDYLWLYGDTLPPDVRRQIEHFTVTLRSTFRINRIKDNVLILDDLGGGGRWEVESTIPTVGLEKSDIIDTRIVFFRGKLIIGGGTILHPREAHALILSIVARANAEAMPPREMVDHLDKMRLKLDKYSNVRIQHIYRSPQDARF